MRSRKVASNIALDLYPVRRRDSGSGRVVTAAVCLGASLEGNTLAWRDTREGMLRARFQRLTNHHAGFGPRVRIRDAVDSCNNRAGPVERQISVMELIGLVPDIRTRAGHCVRADRIFDEAPRARKTMEPQR